VRTETDYTGSQSEDIIVSVVAKSPGMKTEKFTTHGWQEKTG